MGAGFGAQHQQHFSKQVGALVPQNIGQLHPVVVSHLFLLNARFGVGRGQQRCFWQYFAIVFHCIKRATAGKGFNAAPLFGKVVGQRFAASFKVANGR